MGVCETEKAYASRRCFFPSVSDLVKDSREEDEVWRKWASCPVGGILDSILGGEFGVEVVIGSCASGGCEV